MSDQCDRAWPVETQRVAKALRAGQPEEAYRACSALLVDSPEDPPLNQLAAIAALRTGRTDTALTLAHRSLTRRPLHVPGLVLFGRVARAVGDLAGAAEAFRQAGDLAPGQGEQAFLLCAVLLEKGDSQALGSLDDLLTRFPSHADGWEEIGQVLARAGKPEAALLCYARACIVAPTSARAMRKGALLKELGRPEEAVKALTQALHLGASSGRAWFLLGLCHEDLGDAPKAAHAYREALRQNPTLAEAAVNLGTVLQEAGNLDAAMAAYGEAVAIRPETFGRIAQAMTTSPTGALWLDLRRLRRALGP